MSSNLPPGVSANMIPGNRPEDEEDEEFWEAFHSRIARDHKDESDTLDDRLANDPKLEAAVCRAILLGRDMGYAAGATDASIDAMVGEASRHME